MTPRTLEPVKWTALDPDLVSGMDLRFQPHVVGPLSERGVLCPWPWEFERLPFEPAQVHTCTRCGQRGTPGLEHPDYRDILED